MRSTISATSFRAFLVLDLGSGRGRGTRAWGQRFTDEVQVAIGGALNAELPVQ